MAQEHLTVDVTDPEALVRAAHEVERTRRPRLIMLGDRAIAVLSPVKSRRSKLPGRPLTRDDALFRIVSLGRSEGPNDVSANPDKYLADALYMEGHPSTDQ